MIRDEERALAHVSGIFGGNMREINSISEYIAEINCILDERKNDGDRIVVYRGEPRKYPVPGKPGIYRDTFLKKEPFFEKNLLNESK